MTDSMLRPTRRLVRLMEERIGAPPNTTAVAAFLWMASRHLGEDTPPWVSWLMAYEAHGIATWRLRGQPPTENPIYMEHAPAIPSPFSQLAPPHIYEHAIDNFDALATVLESVDPDQMIALAMDAGLIEVKESGSTGNERVDEVVIVGDHDPTRPADTGGASVPELLRMFAAAIEDRVAIDVVSGAVELFSQPQTATSQDWAWVGNILANMTAEQRALVHSATVRLAITIGCWWHANDAAKKAARPSAEEGESPKSYMQRVEASKPEPPAIDQSDSEFLDQLDIPDEDLRDAIVADMVVVRTLFRAMLRAASAEFAFPMAIDLYERFDEVYPPGSLPGDPGFGEVEGDEWKKGGAEPE